MLMDEQIDTYTIFNGFDPDTFFPGKCEVYCANIPKDKNTRRRSSVKN